MLTKITGCAIHLIRGSGRLWKPQAVLSQLSHKLCGPSMFSKGHLTQSENLPSYDPKWPDVRLDWKGQGLQGLRSHPAPWQADLGIRIFRFFQWESVVALMLALTKMRSRVGVAWNIGNFHINSWTVQNQLSWLSSPQTPARFWLPNHRGSPAFEKLLKFRFNSLPERN